MFIFTTVNEHSFQLYYFMFTATTFNKYTIYFIR